MNAEQRQMFQDTLLEDEASLEAQLAELRAALPETTPSAPKAAPQRHPRSSTAASPPADCWRTR
jgi:hypothetical protein